MSIVKSNRNQVGFVQDLQKDISKKEEVLLSGNGSQYYALMNAARGFTSYQVSNADADLSASLVINLEMSDDGENWLQAVDANGDDITHTLTSGSTIMEKLSDVNPFVKLRLNFSTVATGTLSVFTRI